MDIALRVRDRDAFLIELLFEQCSQVTLNTEVLPGKCFLQDSNFHTAVIKGVDGCDSRITDADIPVFIRVCLRDLTENL